MAKKKMGRPRIQIDFEEVDKLLMLQCTALEICAWFDCTEDTLNYACKREKKVTFSVYSKQKRQKGLISLRRKQLQVALNGNVAMLIFLGKQYLGQSDKVVSEVENKYAVGDNFKDEAS